MKSLFFLFWLFALKGTYILYQHFLILLHDSWFDIILSVNERKQNFFLTYKILGRPKKLLILDSCIWSSTIHSRPFCLVFRQIVQKKKMSVFFIKFSLKQLNKVIFRCIWIEYYMECNVIPSFIFLIQSEICCMFFNKEILFADSLLFPFRLFVSFRLDFFFFLLLNYIQKGEQMQT